MTEEVGLKCTCACIDCIEGHHCGGDFWVDQYDPITYADLGPVKVGECEYPSLDALFDENEYDDECHDCEFSGPCYCDEVVNE